jgi:hypothetical protein
MKDGLLKCSREHLSCKEPCENSTCRYWISYEDEQNCSLISIYENGPMTLRDIAERMGVSFARVKQIQDSALQKLKSNPALSSFKF